MNLHEVFDTPVPTIVLAEGEFGSPVGKTANGVVRHSTVFDARVVIDSETAGRSAGDVLDDPSVADVPVVSTIDEARSVVPDAEAFVIGVAPAGGALPDDWIPTIEAAIEAGCDVVSGLHVFLGDDDHWRSLAAANGVELVDVRKPDEDLFRVVDGSRDDVDAQVVLTLGTDCAVGKRTTTVDLYEAAIDRGIDAGWVATGQTGIMVGADRGVVVDRVPADFTAGVVEHLVVEEAAESELLFVEGQGSLGHRAYSGVTLSILHGAWPDAVVLADEPGRERRAHYEQFPVDGVAWERDRIEDLSDAPVTAISTWGDPERESDRYDLPAGNVQRGHGPRILDAVLKSLDL